VSIDTTATRKPAIARRSLIDGLMLAFESDALG